MRCAAGRALRLKLDVRTQWREAVLAVSKLSLSTRRRQRVSSEAGRASRSRSRRVERQRDRRLSEVPSGAVVLKAERRRLAPSVPGRGPSRSHRSGHRAMGDDGHSQEHPCLAIELMTRPSAWRSSARHENETSTHHENAQPLEESQRGQRVNAARLSIRREPPGGNGCHPAARASRSDRGTTRSHGGRWTAMR